jgi:hypothetical protein
MLRVVTILLKNTESPTKDQGEDDFFRKFDCGAERIQIVKRKKAL